MKKFLFCACCALLAVASCSSNFDDAIENDYVEIRIDKKSYEHVLRNETPYEIFFCKDCGMFHILFEGYDYND